MWYLRKYKENKREPFTVKVFEKGRKNLLKHIIYPNCKESQKAEVAYWENLGYKVVAK